MILANIRLPQKTAKTPVKLCKVSASAFYKRLYFDTKNDLDGDFFSKKEEIWKKKLGAIFFSIKT